jgi:hypothetical protein
MATFIEKVYIPPNISISERPAPAPVAPVAPVEPVGPVEPVVPVGPVGPVGPVEPVVPVGPVAPISPAEANVQAVNVPEPDVLSTVMMIVDPDATFAGPSTQLVVELVLIALIRIPGTNAPTLATVQVLRPVPIVILELEVIPA